MGISGGKQSYEVEMTAQCVDTDIYFTYSTLYVKPENNSDWFESPIKHEAYLKKYSRRFYILYISQFRSEHSNCSS